MWSGIAAGVFCLVAITDLSNGSTTVSASSAPPAGVAVSIPTSSSTPSLTPPPSAPATAPAVAVETTTVTQVVDGDTLRVADGREIQLIGVDACETSTRGGREAKDTLDGFVRGQQLRLVPDGSRDADDQGRLLRRAETASSYVSSGTDIGGLMIGSPAVGLADGQEASASYLAELRSGDYGDRDCSGTPPVASTDSTDSTDVDPDLDGPSPGDQGLPDGALTGGYCKKKWWC